MKWFEKGYGIKFVSLRYFNAAGAHENGDIGEDHEPETHLIPLILQVKKVSGWKPKFSSLEKIIIDAWN